MVWCFGFTDFQLITLVLAWWSQFSSFPGCAGHPGLFFINSLLLVPLRCLRLAFLLSKLFLIRPFAFLSACIVGNIIFFQFNRSPQNLILLKQLFYYLSLFLWVRNSGRVRFWPVISHVVADEVLAGFGRRAKRSWWLAGCLFVICQNKSLDTGKRVACSLAVLRE